MGIIGDIFKGMVMLSMIAVLQNGCSVKNMASGAASANKKGLSSYGGYSRALIGSDKSWARQIKGLLWG